MITDRIPKESEFDVGLKQNSVLVGPCVGGIVVDLLGRRDESRRARFHASHYAMPPALGRIVGKVVVGIEDSIRRTRTVSEPARLPSVARRMSQLTLRLS